MIGLLNKNDLVSILARQLKRNASDSKCMKILFLAILASVANSQNCVIEPPETNEVNALSQWEVSW